MSDSTQHLSDNVQQPLISVWRVPWDFAVHALVGTSIFAIIAAPAVFIDLAVHRLEPYGIGPVIILGLKTGEYALLGTDLWLFGMFLWRTARRTIQNL
jgi:hypothetical protein